MRILNAPRNLYQFGVSPDEVKVWKDNVPTIGKFIEVLAHKTAERQNLIVSSSGKREHVWIIFCAPDSHHYDHTFHIVNGLVQDEKLRVSPTKIIPPDGTTSHDKHWRQHPQWSKLLATVNFLDIRLINLPITTVVASALAHGEDGLLQSFKNTAIEEYRDQITRERMAEPAKWTDRLAERRQQTMNARNSIGGSNLFHLLRDMPAEPQKGGNPESAIAFAQYLHLRKLTNEQQLHRYLGLALGDLLKHHRFPGFVGVETETPLMPGQTDPVPDITIHTETDVYALEFHFRNKQIASSEASRYAVDKVIEKYMRSLPHLSSMLRTLD